MVQKCATLMVHDSSGRDLHLRRMRSPLVARSNAAKSMREVQDATVEYQGWAASCSGDDAESKARCRSARRKGYRSGESSDNASPHVLPSSSPSGLSSRLRLSA